MFDIGAVLPGNKALMFIPSVIAVKEGRSVFTKEERLAQTIKQGESLTRPAIQGPVNTVLVEMSRKGDLTSDDVYRLAQCFDYVILAYNDETLMDYVHNKSHKSISEAYLFLSIVTFAKAKQTPLFMKFDGRYHFTGVQTKHHLLKTLCEKPYIRYHDENKQACTEFYSITDDHYDTYEKHIKALLNTCLVNEQTVMDIEKALYLFAKEVGVTSVDKLHIRGYNSLGAFNYI